MSTLTDTLANDAVCIDQCIPDGEKLAVLIAIFYQLSQIEHSGYGSPLGVVTPVYVGQTYFDTSGGNGLWVSNGLGKFNWVRPTIT